MGGSLCYIIQAEFAIEPVTYTVKLHHFWHRRDVSRDLDESVMKKITTASDASRWLSPKDMASVRAHVRISLVDGTCIHDSLDQLHGEPMEFLVDDMTVIRGIEEGLLTMKEGETAELEICPAHAYGADGDPDIGVPPDSTVVAVVTLVDFDNDPDAYELEEDEKLKHMAAKRRMGNDMYKRQEYHRALRRYWRALSYFKDTPADPGQKETVQKGQLPCYLNIAICHLKLKEYRQCCESCDLALKIEASASYIITSLPTFKSGAPPKKSDVRCVLHPSTDRCWMLNASRIQN